MLAEDRQVGNIERLLYLKKLPLVAGLSPVQLAVVAEASRPRVFRRGEALLREGARPEASYVVLEGRVHLTEDGRSWGRAEAGAGLGGVNILAGLPASSTATAELDTLTLELEADAYGDLLEDHFSILRHLLREIAGKIIEGWRRLAPGTPPLAPRQRVAKIMSGRDLDLVERIFFLRQVHPFGRSSINALAELARGLSEAHFAAGERLWAGGDPARHVFLLVSGEVHCSAAGGVRFSAHPGTPLGALEAVAATPRFYDAEVTAAATGLVGEIETAFDVFEDNFGMAFDFLTALSQWLLVITSRIGQEAPEHLAAIMELDMSGVSVGAAAVRHSSEQAGESSDAVQALRR